MPRSRINKDNTDSRYESATSQSGIYAGKEGFDIYVENNTDLKGGIISSEKDKNKLSTGTLTFEDVHNSAEYSSENKGININTSKNADRKNASITPNIEKIQKKIKSRMIFMFEILGICIVILYLYSIIKINRQLSKTVLSKKLLYSMFIANLFVISMFIGVIFFESAVVYIISLSITIIAGIISKCFDRKVAIILIDYYKNIGDIENVTKWQEKLDKMKYDDLGWIIIVIGFSILIFVNAIKNA